MGVYTVFTGFSASSVALDGGVSGQFDESGSGFLIGGLSCRRSRPQAFVFVLGLTSGTSSGSESPWVWLVASAMETPEANINSRPVWPTTETSMLSPGTAPSGSVIS